MTANADIVHGYGERRHLPECPVPAMEAGHGPLHPEDAEANCICTELRACEQRVRQEIDREAFLLDEGDPFRQVYRKGLDAAREAVAALPMMKIAGNFPLYDADDVIAAIDALREQP